MVETMNFTLTELLEQIYIKLTREVTNAYYNNEINDIMVKYDLLQKVEDIKFYNKNAKILVLGALSCNKDDLIKKAKSLGIKKEQIEFGPDYINMHNFNYEKLRNNTSYSDVLVGPVPHKGKGIEGYSSFLAMVQSNPQEFPNIIKLDASNELKITKSSFEKALVKSNLYSC